VSLQEDRASDKRIAITVGVLMLVEIVLGYIADAGTIGLGVWLVLAVGAVLVTGGVFAVVQRRTDAGGT
jgi:hypothetical protein